MISQRAKNSALITCVGAGCAAIILNIVPVFEGTILYGYLDPIGIVTKCSGDTSDVILGKKYTPAECEKSLEQALIKHADAVLHCTPVLNGRSHQLAAAISFAYNVGPTAYCNSTAAKRFNRGDWPGACKAFNENDYGKQQWVYSRKGGELIVLPGLVKRRAIERKLCETGL